MAIFIIVHMSRIAKFALVHLIRSDNDGNMGLRVGAILSRAAVVCKSSDYIR